MARGWGVEGKREKKRREKKLEREIKHGQTAKGLLWVVTWCGRETVAVEKSVVWNGEIVTCGDEECACRKMAARD